MADEIHTHDWRTEIEQDDQGHQFVAARCRICNGVENADGILIELQESLKKRFGRVVVTQDKQQILTAKLEPSDSPDGLSSLKPARRMTVSNQPWTEEQIKRGWRIVSYDDSDATKWCQAFDGICTTIAEEWNSDEEFFDYLGTVLHYGIAAAQGEIQWYRMGRNKAIDSAQVWFSKQLSYNSDRLNALESWHRGAMSSEREPDLKERVEWLEQKMNQAEKEIKRMHEAWAKLVKEVAKAMK